VDRAADQDRARAGLLSMHFFSREWHSGDLSDAESDERERRYREEHLPAILPRLPRALAELARNQADTGELLGIHDARIRRVVIGLGSKSVSLELRTGDEGQGYADLDLEFRRVDLARLDRSFLKRVALDPRTELLYDEVDVEADGCFVYRVLLWPDRETLELVFRDLGWRRTIRAAGTPVREREPFLELT
jgi:hypothetical protein